MAETKRPPVVYGIAHRKKARLVVRLRALARNALRQPTRALLLGLDSLDRKLHKTEAVDASRPKSRVVGARAAASATPGPIPQQTLVRNATRPRSTRDLPRILLLNPPRLGRIPVSRFFRSEYLFVDEHAIPATDLAYFAAAAKDRAELALIEANAEDIDENEVLRRIDEFRPDIIVVKGLVNVLDHDLTAPIAYKKRHPETKIVLSSRSTIGAEAAVFSRFPLLDAIARGEVDAFAEDIARRPDLEGIDGLCVPGSLSSTIRVVEDLDRFPIPAFELMPKVWYRGEQSGRASGFSSAYFGSPSGYYLIASRGCPYTCTYCMTGGIHGRPFRMRKRDPENIAEEARRLHHYGLRDFYFYDEIFTMPGHAEPVSEKLIATGLKMNFVCDGKPDLVTRPMLDVMKRAGCLAVYYGIESGDPGILRDIEKGHTVEHARRAIAMTRDAGLLAGAYVMLGFPSESMHSVLRTAAFLLESEPDMIRYNFLMPYPVTVIHQEMVDAGLLDFELSKIDRRINARHDAGISQRSRSLSPRTLQVMDALFKLAFATELARSPVIPAA